MIYIILGSISLLEFSYTRSEDDLDVSVKKWKKHRPSSEFAIDHSMKNSRKSLEKKVVLQNNTTFDLEPTTLNNNVEPVVCLMHYECY